jgi:hypothetical protein
MQYACEKSSYKIWLENFNETDGLADLDIIIIIIIIIILYYFCAESTATRPITDTAQCRYK